MTEVRSTERDVAEAGEPVMSNCSEYPIWMTGRMTPAGVGTLNQTERWSAVLSFVPLHKGHPGHQDERVSSRLVWLSQNHGWGTIAAK